MTTPFMPPSDLRRPQVRVAKTTPVGIVTYPGVEILDFTGPMEVFAFANHGLQRSGMCSELAYPMEVLAAKPGPITTSCDLQIIANLRYALGLRKRIAPFGHQTVSNENCLSRHERPNDRHLVYRFLEPRFLKARENLGPQQYVSCHTEHKKQRVTLSEIGYCVNCHKQTKLRKDPLDVPHDLLIALNHWESCLGCHDFHGNHIMKTSTTVEQIIPAEKIRAYFQGGLSR